MIVRVQLFAQVKQLAGEPLLTFDLPEGVTVAELRRHLAQRLPAAEPLLRQLVFAVNRAYVPDTAPIPPDAEVACIPPVSGG